MMVFEDFTKKLVNRMETRLGKGYRICLLYTSDAADD